MHQQLAPRKHVPQEYRSQFLGESYDESRDSLADRETLSAVAALMGISVAEVEAEINNKIREHERIHKLAYQKKRKTRDQLAGGVSSFLEVVSFHGKQLFWSITGQEFVVNAYGKIHNERSLGDALHKLACE